MVAEEITDTSNIDVVVVCLGWVSEKFEVEEEFAVLYEVTVTGSEVIYGSIIDGFNAVESFYLKGVWTMLR